MFDGREFKAGDRVAGSAGAWAEVLSVSEDGERLRVRFTGEGVDPPAPDTEGEMARGEIASLSPAPPGPAWGERVAVVVHRVPESAESEEGYGAVTMGGVPLGVSVEATDADTAQEALERLLGALRAFGYAGTVAVEDATYIGGVNRYEVEA